MTPKARVRIQLALLAVLLLAAGLAVRRAIVRLEHVRIADEVCSALERGDTALAIRQSEGLADRVGAGDETLLRALECRALAQVAAGEPELGEAELAGLLLRPDLADWLPPSRLVAGGLDHLLREGRDAEALEVVRRARSAGLDDWSVSVRELRARLAVEDASEVLDDFSERAEAGELDQRVRMAVAARFTERAQYERALQLLGERPPADGALRHEWYWQRAWLVAAQGDPAPLAALFERWRADGLGEAELRARFALLMSARGLTGSLEEQVAMLRGAVELEDRLDDAELKIKVRSRLIRVLAWSDRFEEALRLYDESESKFGRLGSLRREEISRLRVERSSPGGENARLGTGRIVLTGLQEGDRVLVSPPEGADASEPFRTIAVSGGSAALERPAGERPIWWVVRNRSGAVVGQGTVWAEPGGNETVVVERRAARRRGEEPIGPEPARADGRRRVALVLLDCADWRIFRYLQAAGDAPTFERLLGESASAVLISDPPYTAEALRRLTSPAENTVGVLQLAHQLGEEIAALNFVGRNPVGFLDTVLPREPNLFETIGAGRLRAANLLEAIGKIQSGRNAVVIGPDSRVEPLRGLEPSRPLRADELAAIAGLERDLPEHRAFLEEAARDFDSLLGVIADGEVDFVASRVASLDLITHATFGELSDRGQHDGDSALLRFYRYLDLRLAEVRSALDGDDVLIVMSDHGIRTSFEHDTAALFLIRGPGFEPGPRIGTFELGGVGRLVAELLGVETDWDWHGLEQLGASASTGLPPMAPR